VDVVKSLLADPRASNPPLRPGEIGVMAPWREQVWKLRERLRKEGLHAVDVGTVEVRNSCELCQQWRRVSVRPPSFEARKGGLFDI